MENRSSERRVATSQIRLMASNGESEFRMVLPEIHPGPYHPVGGSNIPYLIYKNLDSSAMVMHSISDHALNLPSKNEVENYLKNLGNSKVKEEGLVCTEPVTVQINKARVIGLRFGNNPLLFLSLSPHGMEDIPNYMKKEIEQLHQLNQQLSQDAHNLASALKGQSKVQGDWGEFQLETLLENSGLQKGIHFFSQMTFRDDEAGRGADGEDLRGASAGGGCE